MEKGIDFKHIEPGKISENAFKIIGEDWMLITAGKEDSFNTMTASWGGLGILWHKPVSYSFVRPSRYTFEFMEKYNIFTFSFFEKKYRTALNILGSKSGRDGDKISETGLTPVAVDHDAVAFKEASLVIVNKKLYYQDLNPGHFLEPGIAAHYPKKDYHRMYVGEIITVLSR